MVNPATARWNVDSQSMRSQRLLFSDQNPLMAPVAAMADAARDNRARAPETNPYKVWEKSCVDVAASWINLARDARDGFVEQYFYGVWNTPAMRTIGAAMAPRISQVPGTDLRAVPEVRSALAQMGRGNFAVAVVRMLLLLAASRTSVRRDRLERSNELLTKQEPFASLGEETRTRIIHQQNLIVEFEPEQALATLPKLLPRAEDRPKAIELCRYVTGTDEEMAPETREVMDKIRQVLEVHEAREAPAKLLPAPRTPRKPASRKRRARVSA
jgi:tellurite resistance protein